jgi:hypothetical protein
MKNIVIVVALVLVSLPAMGQDKEPVKKPQAETVKKVAQQPDLAELGVKLKAAIAAGKLTEEEAKAIYAKAAAGQGKSKEGTKPKPVKVDLEGLKTKLEAAIAAGKITEEEAKAIYAKATAGQGKSKEGTKSKPVKVDLEGLKAKLEAAIAAGKITEEEAKAIYSKTAAGQDESKDGAKFEKGGLAEAYEKVAQEVRAALKVGKITEQQAKEKLSAFKKQLAQKAPAKEGVKKPAATRPDLYQLFLLVEKGELTAAEAIKKYKVTGTKKEIPAKPGVDKKP